MHPLLQRQLKRLGLDPECCPSELATWRAMLDRVSQSYAESDQGRTLLEQSLDVTSREMQGLYEELRCSSETELAKERNKLEAVLHSLGDGLCVVDEKWKILMINPQAERLFDAPLTALKGRPVYHLLSPGPEEFSDECLITDTSIPPLKFGIPYRTDDGILLRKDGHLIPVSLVVTPVANEGIASGAVLVFRDITSEKCAADQQAQNAALLRRVQAGLLELATNADIYRGEPAKAFQVVTRVAAQSLRVARASVWFFTEPHDAIRCANLYEQSADRHSSGIELPASAFPRYFAELATEHVIAANQAQTDPRTAEFTDSYLIPIGITSMLDIPIRSEGKMVGVICHEHIGPSRIWTPEEQQFATSVAGTVSLVLEAADRHKAEKETERSKNFLNSVIENLPIMVFVKDAEQLRFVRWNKAAEDLTGITRDTVIGKSDYDLFPQDEAAFFTQKDREVIESRCLRDIPEELIATGDRGTRILHTRKIPILNEQGHPEYLLGISEDITERKQGEEALRKAKEAAEAASVAKSQFLANMSHEIRTPMNGVLGLAALLMETTLTPKQRQLAQTIVRSGTSLVEIINNILDFSKIEAGKLELESTDFHLRLLLDDVLELFAAPAHRKQVELIGEISDAVPTFVKGDPARLRQILVNLIGNAIKFTSLGEVALAVHCLAGGEDRSVLRFSVKDTGIGISPDSLKTLFQPFSQADGSTTRRYGGTGLGLAIVKQLVELMGGEIWVESQNGEGSTFFFTIHIPHSQLDRNGPPFSNQALRNHRVLIIDDNASLRLLLDRQFRGWGMSPTLAASGQEGLQLFSKAVDEGTPFDSVILDLEMPHMSGLQTIQAIREAGQLGQTRVILLAPVQWPEAADASSALVTATLIKPLKLSELHRILSGHAVPPVLPQSNRKPENLTLSPACKQQGTILLAEDNAVNQQVTLGMLEVLGFAAVAVENGKQAIDNIQQQPFSLVLMDCQMPEMDGFTATRAIRSQEKETGTHIPILALTANALEGDRNLCLAAGMDDYLSKPFTLEQLRNLLDRWMPRNSQDSEQPPSPAPTTTPPPENRAQDIDRGAWKGILALQRPGQPDLLAKIMGLYLKDSHELVDKILAAVESLDVQRLRESSHSLKSRSATLGAMRVAEICKELETAARAQQMDRAPELASDLKDAFSAACGVFQTEIHKRAA